MIPIHDASRERAEFLRWLKSEYQPIAGGWQY